MKFAKEGFRVAGIAAAVAVLLGVLFGKIALLAGAALALGVLLFFRDPERSGDPDVTAVLSPADGRVVYAESGAKPHRFAPEDDVKIAIFMSPLDVHVNRSPIAATVEKVEHRPGRFGAAYRSDADEINESTSMLLRTASGAAIVVVQIAGFLARRIVNRVAPPRRLEKAERFGLIMIGSRVDVYLPRHARIAVKPGQTVRAGLTVLAWLDSPEARTGDRDEPKAA